MTPANHPEPYNHRRFPGEIISHGVWFYDRFSLSYRDVSALLIQIKRGIDVPHESIRKWCGKFGQDDANRLRRRRPQPGDKWHLDEVFLTIHGERHDLWQSVNQNDNVLDVLVAEPSRQEGGEDVLLQVAQGVNVCAAGKHHR